jgi:chromosomal replication initiation ATPase DnaA
MIPARVQAIISAVAYEHGIPISDIMSDRRTREISRARHAAMRTVRALENPKPSTTRIGEWFGRDHATVLYACSGKRR